MQELKPCPHCKGRINLKKGFGGLLFFKCTKCGATTSFDNDVCNSNPQKAIEAWNKRVGEWDE